MFIEKGSKQESVGGEVIIIEILMISKWTPDLMPN